MQCINLLGDEHEYEEALDALYRYMKENSGFLIPITLHCDLM